MIAPSDAAPDAPPEHPADDTRDALSGAARLGAPDLKALPDPALTPAACPCARWVCPGWESVNQPLGPPLLRALGSLRPPGDDEPTVQEWPGSHLWSPATPIAPDHYPCNRSTVWACARCGRGFLQYTEFGGYYVDHRLREVDPAKVV